MRLLLNGSDWRANHFLPERLARTGGGIDGMLMQSSKQSDVCWCKNPPADMLPATVPGCDRTVLLENNLINDPYYDRNTLYSLWSEDVEWCFRKDFVLPEEWAQNRRTELVIHSAGYRAGIYVNQEFLGNFEGMFTQWRVDVSDLVKPGESNYVSLVFMPAPKASANYPYDAASEFSVYHHAQVSFGWDWARRLIPTGIFDDVELVGTKDVRIKDAYFHTSGNQATVEVEFGFVNDCETTLQLDLSALNHDGKGHTVELPVRGSAGKKSKIKYSFELDDARYWFPNGYGEQNLYTLKLTVPGDEFKCQVGFRDLKMVRNQDSPEEAYPLTFEVNGKKVFARGGNWVPVDMMFSRISEADYERQIRLAKAANFNLMRVWGGGLIEKRAFYDACDRHGILVWQEFAHACTRYPADNKYLAMKKREAKNALRKMRNHCSMAMYCGGNEVQYYGEIYDSPLYKQYKKVVKKMAPDMPYHTSCPDLSRPGERHHGPWNFTEHKFWNTHHRLLASELGCNGWAEKESLDKCIPQSSPMPGGQAWLWHFTYDNAGRPLKNMTDLFAPDKTSRRQYSQCTMACQADQLSYIMGHYRKKFPVSSGCFIWQYNESFPTNSFSIIDFYSMPKMCYYALARVNEPVILFAEDDSWLLKDGKVKSNLYLVSDSTGFKNATASFILLDTAGRVLLERAFKGDFSAGTTLLGEIDAVLDSMPADGMAIGRTILTDENGRRVYCNERIYGVPDFTKAFQLEQAELSVEKSIVRQNGETLLTVKVSNKGSIAAVNVRTHLSDVDFTQVYWQQNYQHIMPGETVTFTAAITGDLATAPAVQVYAWNHPETIF